MFVYVDLFLVSFFITLCLTPWVYRFAFAVNALDRPNARKIHELPTPRIGGLAMYGGFYAGIAVLYLSGMMNHTLWGVVIGSLILLGVGYVDDTSRKGMFAPLKLGGQLLAAFLVVHYFGVRIEFFKWISKDQFFGCLISVSR